MRNTLVAATMIATGFLALPRCGHAAGTDGFFVNGNIGRSSVSAHGFDDDDTGYAVNFGYRWAVAPNALIGIETGYSDLGRFSYDTPEPVTTLKTSLSGWNIGANGHFAVADHWYISGRLGLYRANVEVRSRYYNDDYDSNKWYAGVGFGYDFGNAASVGLNYDYYKTSHSEAYAPRLLSVSGEYRF